MNRQTYQDAKLKLREDGLLPLLSSVPGVLKSEVDAKISDTIFASPADDDVSPNILVEYANERFEIVKPSSTNLPEKFSRYSGVYNPQSSAVYSISDVCLIGKKGIGIRDRQPVIGTTRGEEHKFYQYASELSMIERFQILRDNPCRETTGKESGFHMIAPNNSYYVWIAEFLPKLRGLHQYNKETEGNVDILIKEEPPDWMVESLELMGFSSDRTVEIGATPTQIRNLILARHRHHGVSQNKYNPYPPSDFEWIQERTDSQIQNPSGPEKVYISRRDAPRRHVTNENEVIEMLESEGFHSFEFAKLSVLEQAEIMKSADTVVGLHGAGFANMIFASELSIVELIPEDYLWPRHAQSEVYYCLSRLLGFDYDCILCDTVESDLAPRERDVRINVGELQKHIK